MEDVMVKPIIAKPIENTSWFLERVYSEEDFWRDYPNAEAHFEKKHYKYIKYLKYTKIKEEDSSFGSLVYKIFSYPFDGCLLGSHDTDYVD
jgi:hypothetical protein